MRQVSEERGLVQYFHECGYTAAFVVPMVRRLMMFWWLSEVWEGCGVE